MPSIDELIRGLLGDDAVGSLGGWSQGGAPIDPDFAAKLDEARRKNTPLPTSSSPPTGIADLLNSLVYDNRSGPRGDDLPPGLGQTQPQDLPQQQPLPQPQGRTGIDETALPTMRGFSDAASGGPPLSTPVVGKQGIARQGGSVYSDYGKTPVDDHPKPSVLGVVEKLVMASLMPSTRKYLTDTFGGPAPTDQLHANILARQNLDDAATQTAAGQQKWESFLGGFDTGGMPSDVMTLARKLGPDAGQKFLTSAVGKIMERAPTNPDFETFVSPDGTQKRTVNKNGPDAVGLVGQGWLKYNDVKDPSRLTYRPATADEKELNGFPRDQKGGQVDSAGQFHAPAASAGGLLTPEDLDFSAAQMLAGDMSPMQGLGVGATGARNRAALRSRYNSLAVERGIAPEDAAAKSAEMFGTRAAERALGTRSANIEMSVNEASNMGKLAREASAKVPRGSWMPANKALNAWNSNTGDPATRAFGAAINSYLNAYATAVGKGQITDANRNHAADMLSTADGPAPFNAIMDQLDKEMEAARAAPGQVRSSLRSAVTGRSESSGSGNIQQWGRDANGKPVPVR